MKKAYTLIETLIAMAIMMIVVLAFLRAYTTANISTNKIKDKQKSLLICKNELEKLKSNVNELDRIYNLQGKSESNIIEEKYNVLKSVEKQENKNLALYTITVKTNNIELKTKIMYSK